jgi:probable addiction module antidote protein
MEAKEQRLISFENNDGSRPFEDWLDALRDRKAAAVIKARLIRVRNGNFGHCDPVGEGVPELKIDFGLNTKGDLIMANKGRDYKDYLSQNLKNADEAAHYLDAALADGNKDVFLVAIRDVADARLGGIANLADKAGLNRESLYRTLSEKGNPELSSLEAVLDALGLRLSIESKKAS